MKILANVCKNCDSMTFNRGCTFNLTISIKSTGYSICATIWTVLMVLQSNQNFRRSNMNLSGLTTKTTFLPFGWALMFFVGISLLSSYSITQNAMIFETEKGSTKLWQVETNKQRTTE